MLTMLDERNVTAKDSGGTTTLPELRLLETLYALLEASCTCFQ